MTTPDPSRPWGVHPGAVTAAPNPFAPPSGPGPEWRGGTRGDGPGGPPATAPVPSPGSPFPGASHAEGPPGGVPYAGAPYPGATYPGAAHAAVPYPGAFVGHAGPPGYGPFPGLGHPPLGAPARRGARGLAIAGLVLGLGAVGLLTLDAWVGWGGLTAVGFALAVVGLVLGTVGTTGTRGAESGREVAVAGLTSSAVAAVLGASVLAVVALGVAPWSASPWGAGVSLPVLSLRPGESATIGDYTVTVDEIQMDADAALAALPGNPPAEGRYVQAVVTVVYEGTGYGLVEDDLMVSYAGSDDEWLYDELTCAATTDRPVTEVERLTPGATATFVACMDVPVDVVRDTAVIVEDLTAWEFSAETWGAR